MCDFDELHKVSAGFNIHYIGGIRMTRIMQTENFFKTAALSDKFEPRPKQRDQISTT